MKTLLLRLSALAIAGTASILVSPSAQAGSLTTTFVGGNGQDGNMFDVQVFGNPLTVTGLDLNIATVSSAPVPIEVYIKPGSYVGFETNASAWTLVSSNILNAFKPAGTPTFLDVTDFALNASSNYGFYITVSDVADNLAYTDGNGTNQSYSNADLALTLGVGKSYPFGLTFNPRVWNGTIYYDVGVTSTPVPSPAMLPGLIGAGVAMMRKKRGAEAEAEEVTI